MEKIEIEVDNDTARKWRNTNTRAKQHISREIDRLLKTVLAKQEDTLWPFLEKLRSEAEQKGFNDELLEEILNEEE